MSLALLDRMVAEASGCPELRSVERLEITAIVDDTLGPFEGPRLIPDHQFCAAIRVSRGGIHRTVLFDTGVDSRETLYNIDDLRIGIDDVEAIVLSHAHADHARGVSHALESLGMPRPAVVLHPDAYLRGEAVRPGGEPMAVRRVRREDLEADGLEVRESYGPTLLVEGTLLVSGEVPGPGTRKGLWAACEGLRTGRASVPGARDDQFVVANVREKGLVIVTGCAQRGVIDVIRHARALTGVDRVHAVLGGFHLAGDAHDSGVSAAVEALREIEPRYLVPARCAGWSVVEEIARRLPDAFVPETPGTTYVF